MWKVEKMFGKGARAAAWGVAVLAIGAVPAEAQTITEFPLPGNAEATGLTATPAALWAAAPGAIIRFTTAGTATTITGGGIASRKMPFAIAAGPDGRVWWAEQENDDGDDAVGAVTGGGTVTRFPDDISEFGALADITPGVERHVVHRVRQRHDRPDQRPWAWCR